AAAHELRLDRARVRRADREGNLVDQLRARRIERVLDRRDGVRARRGRALADRPGRDGVRGRRDLAERAAREERAEDETEGDDPFHSCVDASTEGCTCAGSSSATGAGSVGWYR